MKLLISFEIWFPQRKFFTPVRPVHLPYLPVKFPVKCYDIFLIFLHALSALPLHIQLHIFLSHSNCSFRFSQRSSQNGPTANRMLKTSSLSRSLTSWVSSHLCKHWHCPCFGYQCRRLCFFPPHIFFAINIGDLIISWLFLSSAFLFILLLNLKVYVNFIN